MKNIILLIVVCLLVFSPVFIPGLFAQAQPPDHTATPIDGGASILLALGVFYGLRKLFKSGKKSQ